MKNKLGLTSFALHLLAVLFMFCDHLWVTNFVTNNFFTYLGRLAFPIFSFLLVEGFYHTKSKINYLSRLLILALVSEIPFNLMVSGNLFYPFHQNVIWTLLLALVTISIIDKVKDKRFSQLFLIIVSLILGGMFLASFLNVDYLQYGFLTVLVFYFFHGNKWYHYLGKFLGIFLIHNLLIPSSAIQISLFNTNFFLPKQALACLSLIFIFFYNGKQGPYNKLIRTCFYYFYPLHMFLLAIL